MKYSKLSLKSIDSESEMICIDGSGAATSGCSTGPSVGLACSLGNFNVSGCMDGNAANPSGCGAGSGATTNYSRCFVGSSVIDT